MKTQLFKLVAGVALFLTFSWTLIGQDMVEENRTVSSFKEVKVSHGIDLILTQENKSSLKVVAPEDRIEDIITEVEGNTLLIRMPNNYKWSFRNWKKGLKMEVYVSVDQLEGITASGGSDISATSIIRGERLEIESSGGSDITLDIDVESLYCTTSGGSDMDLRGSAEYLEAHTSGGSDLNGKGLKVVDCKISSSGGSDANVSVSGEVDAHASGASDINIYGNPTIKRKSSSGASDINVY